MAVTDWEPATGAEAAMRDALHGNDQQLYFRILSGVELLLPVSAQAAAGRTPVGWGTWTTGGRTHVLAFTSAEAMRACLGEHAGPSRRTGYAELAASWPNHEWWLAVNPGLPIEGYLPAWYVSQLSRGDVRLPGRTVGARARLERVEALNRARDAAAASSATHALPGTTGGLPPSRGAADASSTVARPARTPPTGHPASLPARHHPTAVGWDVPTPSRRPPRRPGAPPSRFRGGQPFPRRGPAGEQPSDGRPALSCSARTTRPPPGPVPSRTRRRPSRCHRPTGRFGRCG